MNALSLSTSAEGRPEGFDWFRLSTSKDEVNLSANTIRAYFKKGLPHYKINKVCFVSKGELSAFIRQHVVQRGAAQQ